MRNFRKKLRCKKSCMHVNASQHSLSNYSRACLFFSTRSRSLGSATRKGMGRATTDAREARRTEWTSGKERASLRSQTTECRSLTLERCPSSRPPYRPPPAPRYSQRKNVPLRLIFEDNKLNRYY